MFKKFVSISLIIALLSLCFPANAFATSTLATNSVSSRIDELFAERSKLCIDFEKNSAAIAKIDAQLKELGLESISEAEVREKLGCTADPLVSLPTSSNTSWSSQRVNTVWNGQSYELQIITGYASGSGSSLTKTTEVRTKSVENKQADKLNLFTIAVDTVGEILLDSISDSSEKLRLLKDGYKAARTIYSVLTATGEVLTTTTEVDITIKESYRISMNSTVKIVFAKAQGSLDYGNQKLVYFGNSIYCTAAASYTYSYYRGNQYIEASHAKEFEQTFQSKYFEHGPVVTRCAEQYWNYRQGYVDLYDVYDWNIWELEIWTNVDKGTEGSTTPVVVTTPVADFYLPEWDVY